MADPATIVETVTKRGFWASLGRHLLSLVTDHEWDLDLYKIGGLASFGMVFFLVFKVISMIEATPAVPIAAVGIVAGLVASMITMGTFLLNFSRQNDLSLMNKGNPAALAPYASNLPQIQLPPNFQGYTSPTGPAPTGAQHASTGNQNEDV